jgi:dCMP deaminase
MYVSLFPCNECTKLIIQSGIKEIIYLNDKPDDKSTIASKRMLDLVGIKYLKFDHNIEVIIKKKD